jgi:hypothetical protein
VSYGRHSIYLSGISPPPEYADQEQGQIDELNQKGSFGPNRKEYIRKDRTRFPISLRGFVLNDVDGRKLVWGIIEDISIAEKAKNKIPPAMLSLRRLQKMALLILRSFRSCQM